MVALLGAVLVSGGCDATRATGPVEGAAPGNAGSPSGPAAQLSGTLLGRATIPAGEGSNAVSANIQLPAAGENMAVVRITGGVSVALNAPASCQGAGAGGWGPGGAPDGVSFRVFFDVVLPTGETIVQSGHKMGENPLEIAIGTNHLSGGRITRVWRRDVNGACWITGKPDPVPLYRVVGEAQVLTVTTLGPATVGADRRHVETRGDTVTFTAGGSGSSITAAYWRFVAGDTLETPGASAGEWINPRCEGQTTCRWAPPVSGRMYVVGAEIDGVYWSGTAAGPVVWVGREPPPCEVQPTLGVASARLSVAGTDCGDPVSDQLLLNCNETKVTAGAPELTQLELSRGDNLNCWVTNANSRGPDPEDVSWVSVPDPSVASRMYPAGGSAPTAQHSSDRDWGGRKVVSSIITVSASLGGVPQPPLSLPVYVKDREWGAMNVPPIPVPVPGPHLPKAKDIANVNAPAGSWGRSRFNLGVTSAEGEGPDAGWHYLTTLPTVAAMDSYVNPGLYPGDPFYEAQGGQGFCTKAQLDGFRQFVIDHENEHQRINTAFHTTGPAPTLLDQAVLYIAPPLPADFAELLTQDVTAAVTTLHDEYDDKSKLGLGCTFNANIP